MISAPKEHLVQQPRAERSVPWEIEIGGIEDHVPVLLTLLRTVTLAQLVLFIKKESSKWLKRECSLAAFAWQNGYGAFLC